MPREQDDEPIRRFSKKPNPYFIPIVGVAVVAVLITIACIVVLVIVLSNKGDVSGGQGVGIPGLVPAADNEGLNWDMKRMAEHLHAIGVIGEYEVQEAKKTPFGDTKPTALARTPGGGKVLILKHGGALSAEQYAKIHDRLSDGRHYGTVPSYQWGAFTITSDKLDDDHATPVASKLRGVKKFLRGELVK